MTASQAQLPRLGRSLLAAAVGPCWQQTGPWPNLWHLQPLRCLASNTGAAAAEQPGPAAAGSQLASGHNGSASSSTSSSSTPVSSNGSGASSAGSVDAEGYRVAYQGFFARPHTRLKYASLLNTFASFAAAPLIISYSSASPVARVAVTVSVLAFAIITTGGLHWFTSPYIHQLLYNDKTDTAKVQTMSFFGGTRWHEFPVAAVQAPTGYHPLASFKVSGKTFYVDKANFDDVGLLGRLVPGGTDINGEETSTQQEHQHQHQQQAGD